MIVKERFDDVYAEYGRPETAAECGALESQCYCAAVDQLDPDDAAEIKTLAFRLTHCKPPIKKMGDISALELLAKLGLFFNGVKPL